MPKVAGLLRLMSAYRADPRSDPPGTTLNLAAYRAGIGLSSDHLAPEVVLTSAREMYGRVVVIVRTWPNEVTVVPDRPTDHVRRSGCSKRSGLAAQVQLN